MGFFSQIMSEARLDDEDHLTFPRNAPPTEGQCRITDDPLTEAPTPSPAGVKVTGSTPTLDLSDTPQESEDERRRAHEAAEAKKKDEWEARQAEKRRADAEAIQRLADMSDEQVAADAAKRVGADTEKLTRRNMKEMVCEHIQGLCATDPAFARRVMHPRKSMIRCFKYINRQARAYAEQEMKDIGIERTGVYGCDIPDALCYQWAMDYFNDPDATEDKEGEEKYTPKPYIPKSGSKSKSKAAQKKQTEKPAQKPQNSMEQMSLLEVS